MKKRTDLFLYACLFIGALMFSAAVFGGCSGNQTHKRTLETAKSSVETAFLATNAVNDAFDAWSKQHQEELVDAAKTKKEAEDTVAEFRVKRQSVNQAIIVAYSSIAAAASSLALFEAEKISETELLLRLTEAVESVLTLKNAVKDLGGS